ncbi:ester cyclase [Chloroflexota bacterium]
MSAEQNKDIARRWMDEVWQNGNEAVIDELLADNFTFSYASPETKPNREGYKQTVKDFHVTFADVQFTTEDMVAEGDKVTVHWKGSTTNKGGFLGLEPTGKQVTVAGISIIQIANGKILRAVVYMDVQGVLEQLGALPLGY